MGRPCSLAAWPLLLAALAATAGRAAAQTTVSVNSKTYRVIATTGTFNSDLSRFRRQPWFTNSTDVSTNGPGNALPAAFAGSNPGLRSM